MDIEHSRVVITGARGRLGRALMAAAPTPATAWGRHELDLDDPGSFASLLDRTRPDLVVHAAAMSDVDACARDPQLAMRRNAVASAALAQACRDVDAGIVIISTNEVFDGQRTDGAGYVEHDEPHPGNPYGASKLAAERAAQAAFDGRPGLWIVRTAWLYGPPGNDFPAKIVAASDRLPPGEPLPVVSDEHGNPTPTADLARSIFEIVEHADGGLFHVVNSGSASRFEWAERVLASLRPGRTVRPISAAAFERASAPPLWGVLDATYAELTIGRPMRPWRAALEENLATR